MANEIVLSKSTALDIADIIEDVMLNSGTGYSKRLDNFVKELRGEL